MVVAALILGAFLEPGHKIDELFDRFLVAIFIEHAFGHLSSFRSGEVCHSDAIHHRIMQLDSEIELPLDNKWRRLSLRILIDNIDRSKGIELPEPLQYLLCPFVR